MRRFDIPTLGLACGALLMAAAPAFCQSTGLGGGSGLGSSGLGGGSGLGSSGVGGSSLGGGGFGSSMGSSGFGFSTTGGASSGAAGRTTGGRAGTAQVGATSFEGPYFYNPFSLGLPTGSAGIGGIGSIGGTTSTTTGSFGAPLYTLTTNTTGTASINTNLQNQMANGFGVGVNIRRLPAYATTLKFAVPPPPPPAQVRVDLQNMLAQTTQLNPADSVRITMDGPAVVLHGRVVDDDERRLVENMMLLSPGVNQVRNELTVAKSGP